MTTDDITASLPSAKKTPHKSGMCSDAVGKSIQEEDDLLVLKKEPIPLAGTARQEMICEIIGIPARESPAQVPSPAY